MKPNVLRDFFKLEMETLQAKTGMRQLETMMAKDGWEVDLSLLLDLLVAECNRPAFMQIGVDVKMKIIREAIISDKDFIGLNAKFVYKSLANWWYANGDRYMEKHTQALPKEQHEPAPPEVAEKYLKEWESSLMGTENNLKGVPVLTTAEIQSEGQQTENILSEQLKKLSPKTGYKAQSAEQIIISERIRKITREMYSGERERSAFNDFRLYSIEGYDIFCESKEKAQEIYIQAITPTV